MGTKSEKVSWRRCWPELRLKRVRTWLGGGGECIPGSKDSMNEDHHRCSYGPALVPHRQGDLRAAPTCSAPSSSYPRPLLPGQTWKAMGASLYNSK